MENRIPVGNSSEIPEVLYKYFSFERREIFEKWLVRFTQPAALNDPFECVPQFQGLDDPAYVAREFNRSAERVRKSVKIEEWPLAEKILAEGKMAQQKKQLVENPEIVRKRYLDSFLSKISEKNGEFGMFCLSERFDSIRMWSHYADSHKGFLIGFNSKADFFARRDYEPLDFGVLRKVNYSNIRPQIMFPYSDANPVPEFLFAKNDEWAYESEWRILRFLRDANVKAKSGVFLCKVPPEAIRTIIFGSRADGSLVQSAIESIRRNPNLSHVRIGRSQLSGNKYSVEVADWA